MADESTHPSLLARAISPQDYDAWREFDRLYRPILERFARGQGLDPVEAEDVAQECMIKACKSLPEFNYNPSKGRFRSWLKTIVVRAIIDRRRKKREVQGGSAIEDVAIENGPSDVDYDQLERRELMKACLESLRPTFRAPHTYEVFSLLVFDGWEVSRICEAFGITQGSVHSIKFHVGTKIRAEMKERYGMGFTAPARESRR